MFRFGMLAMILGCVVFGPKPGANEASFKPRRIVSLNLCVDQILFKLVDRSRIAGMFHLSADGQYSTIADVIGDIPLIRGGAEEVMQLGADLVFAGPFTTKATVALLMRLGHRVVIVPVATSFEAIAANVELIAKSVGEPGRGRDQTLAFGKRLAALKARVGQARVGEVRPLAAVIYTNNFTASPGSLAAEVVAAAGYRNLGTRFGTTVMSRLGVEDIIFHRPDILIKGHSSKDYRTVLGDNLRHPVLERVFEGQRLIEIPEQLWLCGSMSTLDALERLIDARGVGGG